MKKGLLTLLGAALLIAALLVPATAFAVSSTHAVKVDQAKQPHIMASRTSPGKAQNGAKTLVKSNVGTPASSGYTYLNVNYNGGPVMTGIVQVYAIFWEPTGSAVSANYNSLIEQYFNDVGSSSLYQVLKQYTDGQGHYSTGSQLAGAWVDTSTAYPVNNSLPANTILDSDIQNEVAHAQSVNSWSASGSTVFFVFTAQNEGICFGTNLVDCTPNVPLTNPLTQSRFCAYHSATTSNAIYATIPYAASPDFLSGCTPGDLFALAPAAGSSPNNDDADLTINLTSHEQMEATSDPFLNAWYISDNPTYNGAEIGDLCAWFFGPNNTQGGDVTWNGHNYIVQEEWDNASSNCLLSANFADRYYEIVNNNSSLVMDVYGGGTNIGANVIQWPYHTGTNQMWDLVPDGPYYQIVNRNSGLVLDVYGGGTNQGVNIIQWTNHHGFNQQWVLVPYGNYDLIVNVNSGLVMDVFGGGKTQGVNVIQWPSHNGANQQWSFTPIAPYYEIVNVNSNLAMDVNGAVTTQGANVIQWPYHSGSNQQWALVPDGTNNGQQIYQILNLNSDLVMDVYGGGKTHGVNVIQWSNHNGTNQQWYLIPDGTSNGQQIYQIMNVNSGLVMDVSGGVTNQGAPVIQWENHNGANQQWILVPTSA